eukprot:GHVS01077877.1.p1 GENE.GHVS01077877.1~~GHVS01077877.1.p1  ORF type:complete len:245 (+),score=57.56 GHVS01077877.1:589-1323(+)
MSSSVISVDITHSKYADRRWPQIRLDASMSVEEAKARLHQHVGTAPSDMRLYGRRGGEGEWLSLNREDWRLQEYGVDTGWQLYVDDVGGGQVINEERLLLDKSTKVTMTNEEYDKRQNTMRKFLGELKNKGTKEEEESCKKVTDEKESIAAAMTVEEAQERFPIGSRCSVGPGDRRGNIAFVGNRRDGKVWVGVGLDEPLGSTDGTEGGVKVFDCDGMKYGEWARPAVVEVGDFPAVDFLIDEI